DDHAPKPTPHTLLQPHLLRRRRRGRDVLAQAAGGVLAAARQAEEQAEGLVAHGLVLIPQRGPFGRRFGGGGAGGGESRLRLARPGGLERRAEVGRLKLAEADDVAIEVVEVV